MKFAKIAKEIAEVQCLCSSCTKGKPAGQTGEKKPMGTYMEPCLVGLSVFLPKGVVQKVGGRALQWRNLTNIHSAR